MPWIPLDAPDTTTTTKGGRWVPLSGAGAVPDASKMTPAQAVQQLEGGGLKQPAVDPIDVGLFALTGGTSGLAEGGLKLAGQQALREGVTVGGSEAFNASMQPVINRIPPSHPLVRDVAQVATGLAPFVIAGAAPQAASGALRRLGGGAEIGEAATGAAAKASEATEAAKSAVDTTASKANADLDAEYENFRQKQIGPATEEARQETIQRTVGQGPSATMEQGPERIARNEQFRKSVTDPLERWRSDWASRRNKLLAGQAQTVVDDSPLQTVVADDESKWQPNARPYSAAAQRLIDKVKALGAEADPLEEFFTPEQIKKLTKTQRENYLRSLGKTESPAKVESYRTPSPQAVAEQAVPQTPTRTRPKVPELVGLQSEANTLARASKGADRTLALKVVRGIDDALAGADIDVPAYKKIQAEYRDHRLHFPYKFDDAIQSAARPVDTATQIFGEPERALDLANLSNDAERQDLRQLYGQYVSENGTKVVTKEQAPFLAKLFPNSPLSKPESWIYSDKAIAKLSDVLSTAPMAKQKFIASLQQERTNLANQNAQAIVEESLGQTKKLGMAGERIRVQIEAAKTPEEQAKVALQAFGELNPAEQGRQAGISAIQGFEGKDAGFRSSLKRRAQIYATLALPMAMMGRDTMLGYAATLGTVAGVDATLRAALRSSLRDPANAAAFYRSLVNPGASNSLSTIARQVIQSSIPAEAAQAGQAVTAKPQSSAGLMVKHIEEKKAENIAGPRGALSPTRISTIQDTSKQIAAGSAPDIQADLRNGRMSHSDVAQMLKPDKPGLAALFQGLTPQQAVDAFAHADPQEREMTLPALAQHIQENGKNLKPQERQAMLAQLKAVMAPQQSEGEEA